MECKTVGFRYTLLILVFFFISACGHPEKKPLVLVFTKTSGFRHSSVADGVNAIFQLAKQNQFEADTTSDAEWFRDDLLKPYAAVIFLNTTGNLLNLSQKLAMQKFIESGKGFMGVHAAADAEYGWSWYGHLVGAWFNGHPEQQEAVLQILDSVNDATRNLPRPWKRKDEWYNFKNISPDLHLLLAIDEKSYTGGTNGAIHPMAWYHEYDGGR